MCPPERISALALSALAELPAVPVRNALRSETRAHPEAEVRMAALQVLGRQGSAEGLELYFELLAESGDELEQRSVGAVASDALAALLRADGATANALEKPLLAAGLPAQRMACDALGAATVRGRQPPGEALRARSRARRRGARGHDPARRELPLARRRRRPGAPAEGAHARGPGPARRGGPVAGAHEGRAVRAPSHRPARRPGPGRRARGPVVPARDPGDAHHRRGAVAALVRGEQLVEGHGEGGSGRSIRRLDACRNPARALALPPRPRGRGPGGALSEARPAARIVACGALQEIGSRRAVPALVECLFDSDEEIRTSAWRALRTLTGEDLPPEPQVWEDYALD